MSISDEERQKLKLELLEEIKREEEERKKQEELEKAEAMLKARKEHALMEEARKKLDEELRQSEEPWVDIKGMVSDPKHGIKLELDWNPAFIRYLKENGIEGPNDEIVVQRWLQLVSTEVSTDLGLQGEDDPTDSRFI